MVPAVFARPSIWARLTRYARHPSTRWPVVVVASSAAGLVWHVGFTTDVTGSRVPLGTRPCM